MSTPTFHFAGKAFMPRLIFRKVQHPDLSRAVSGDAVSALARGYASPPSRMRGTVVETGKPEWQDRLFTNCAEIKVLTSRVAMHLSDAERGDLFGQIDELLDPENWTAGDNLISTSSYITFLRFLIYHRGVKRPALTVSNAGNVSASWFYKSRRLTIEFLPADTIRTVLYRKDRTDTQPETAAYQGPLLRLDAILEPFDAVSWYRNGPA